MKKLLFAVCLLALLGFINACQKEPEPVKVTEIRISRSSVTLTEGETVTIEALVLPDNADNKLVLWTTSDSSVATVSDGKVTALRAGSALITAMSDDGGKTTTCRIEVEQKSVPVDNIGLNQVTATLTAGGTITLEATVSPYDATDKTVTWTTSDAAVAVVYDGVVTAEKIGTATITATAGDKTAVCNIVVGPTVVTSISLDNTDVSLKVGEIAALTATVSPYDATDKTVTWTTSDAAVAVVRGGLVIAKKVGTATITATAGDKTAVSNIVVEPTNVTSVTLDKSAVTLMNGESVALKARVYPADATDMTVAWTTSDADVAVVDANGNVKGIKSGTATITVKAADGGYTAACEVTVKQHVTGISLDISEVTVYSGDTETLTAMVAPDDAADKTVTWTSSNISIAKVDANGRVTGVKAGTAVITVKTTDGGYTATCVITVKQHVTGISINKTSLKLLTGYTDRLSFTVSPSNASDKSTVWESSNPSVAAVDDSGLVTAISPGNTSISVTANDGGVQAVCQVTVIEPLDYKDGDVVTLQSGPGGLDIIFIGDGFIQEDIEYGTYDSVMKQACDIFFGVEPFSHLKSGFNIYYVNAVSPERINARNTGSNGATNTGTVTKFSTKFTANSTNVDGDVDLAVEYAKKALGADKDKRIKDATIVLIANQACHAGTTHTRYNSKSTDDYGNGYSVAICTIGVDENDFVKVIRHEACGHAFGKLADEYTSNSATNLNTGLWYDLDDMHKIGYYRNADKYVDQNLYDQLSGSFALTTKSNVYWHDLFGTKNNYESAGVESLGVFKGGYTYSFAFCRPTQDAGRSIMNGNTGIFNAISRRQIYYRYQRLSGELGSKCYGTQNELDRFLSWDAQYILPAIRKSPVSTKSSSVSYSGDDKYLPYPPPVIYE